LSSAELSLRLQGFADIGRNLKELGMLFEALDQSSFPTLETTVYKVLQVNSLEEFNKTELF
jgi:hypothetical protein